MQNADSVKSVVRWVALGSLFFIPWMPLIVANGYFFPFISGKAFYFRILVECAFGAWVVLALIDKAYRPRFSLLGAVVVAFVGWMFIADSFAPNAMKAFWSNFERMEGWVFLAHLLAFFLAASAVLRVERMWRAWFLTSLGVSVVIVGYALLQLNGTLAIHQGSTRIDASLGNSAYLAIYFLFNVFIALWLALTSKDAWLKWSLIVLACVEGVLIFFTETRGAILGLVGALALAALLTAMTAGKRARTYALGALALLFVIVGAFYVARDSDFVQNNHVLLRVASISLHDGQTRFTIWNMAFEGVQERPLLGWGQEGFNYVFNKYYDPSLYHQEQWFDRAHNAFIDWLSAGGVPAFLLYLSLYGMAIFLLWQSTALSRPERIALTAALTGYAIHNFFVFDNLYSYVYFFAILALIDSQVARPIEKLENAPELDSVSATTYAVPIVAAITLLFIWYVNITGMQVSNKLIVALSGPLDVQGRILLLEDLAKNPAFAAQEIREQIVSFSAAAVQNAQVTNEEKQRAVSLAVTEMQKQITAYPQDARARIQLSYVYRSIGDMERALEEIRTAITLSPKKQSFWIEAGVAEWNAGNVTNARKDFYTAYELGKQFPALAAYAATGDFIVGDSNTAEKILLEAYGTTNVDSDVLAAAYYYIKDWPRLIALWKTRAEKPNASADVWFSLAAAYYTAGDTASAIQTINKAMALYPESASMGAQALQQIREAN